MSKCHFQTQADKGCTLLLQPDLYKPCENWYQPDTFCSTDRTKSNFRRPAMHWGVRAENGHITIMIIARSHGADMQQHKALSLLHTKNCSSHDFIDLGIILLTGTCLCSHHATLMPKRQSHLNETQSTEISGHCCSGLCCWKQNWRYAPETCSFWTSAHPGCLDQIIW